MFWTVETNEMLIESVKQKRSLLDAQEISMEISEALQRGAFVEKFSKVYWSEAYFSLCISICIN